ncbi:alpha/beta hydrolase [Pseudolysobacter antarcticus]|uniref:Alpha/beta hydrolase n=1 Tax=Pseudolysobacter antarcticus TaxID=2511995 RepID=A0A411HP88_9GAMM|nr:alpha/beta fold hydrolase [Pseudolysobacter antarcticus]QBB72319.1 alpha/beta hydrolase [Pseudolysobacter antarcticus]
MNIESNPSTMDFPATASTLLLPGPAGLIEIATAMPPPDVARAGTALICHPHPLQGGTMQNKVVTTLEKALRELGLATVRFNFRGVGASTGEFDDGIGESDDVRAIAAWIRQVHAGDTLWLAGFSFGSFVALRTAAALDVAQLITVAPPAGRWDFAAITLPDCPWLVIQGEQDEVVDPNAVFTWLASLPSPPTLVRMAETGHFFHHRLLDLRAAIQQGAHAPLPPLRAAGTAV